MTLPKYTYMLLIKARLMACKTEVLNSYLPENHENFQNVEKVPEEETTNIKTMMLNLQSLRNNPAKRNY